MACSSLLRRTGAVAMLIALTAYTSSSDHSSKLVRLDSDQQAQFTVHGVNDVDGADCTKNFGDGVSVRVYPPNHRTPLFLRIKTGSCDPQVSAVTKTGS